MKVCGQGACLKVKEGHRRIAHRFNHQGDGRVFTWTMDGLYGASSNVGSDKNPSFTLHAKKFAEVLKTASTPHPPPSSIKFKIKSYIGIRKM